jgi:hypothetical protein
VTAVAVLVLAMAVADAVRAAAPGLRSDLVATVGAVVALLQIWACGQTTAGAVVLVLVAAATAAAWVMLSARALHAERRQVLALCVPAVGLALTMALSGWAEPLTGPVADWLGWVSVPDLSGVSPEKALLVGALVLAQVATGNVVVRLVLTRVGALSARDVAQPADHLRGGRLLGPMERVFILGLGLAGQLTAAGIVIAAKGLIRWPELRAERDEELEVGIDEVTEYFLVGSFASWLVALASVALVMVS